MAGGLLPISFSEYGTESKRFRYLLCVDRVGQILLKSWNKNMDFEAEYAIHISERFISLPLAKDVKSKRKWHLCLGEFFLRVHQKSDVTWAHVVDQAQLTKVGRRRIVAILPRQVLLGHLLRVEPRIVSYAARQVVSVLGSQHNLHVLLCVQVWQIESKWTWVTSCLEADPGGRWKPTMLNASASSGCFTYLNSFQYKGFQKGLMICFHGTHASTESGFA